MKRIFTIIALMGFALVVSNSVSAAPINGESSCKESKIYQQIKSKYCSSKNNVAM